jgi:hypothetical protein
MKIIIHSPSYEESSGGITVLHKLCDILLEQGFNAGFFVGDQQEFFVNSTYRTGIFKKEDIDTKNDIVVYPEIVLGNPLGVAKVVRYIMNVGHVTLGRMNTWEDTDKWIYYSDKFYDGIKPRVILNISDSKLDYFKNYEVDRPYKECFTYRKNHDNIENLNIVHSKDAIELGFNMSDEYLIKLFNLCERFYCYDTESYLNVLASLCGCDSIIVPNNTSSREEVMKQPAFTYGVAYGEEEIVQARESREKLRQYLLDKEDQQKIDVKELFTEIVNTL